MESSSVSAWEARAVFAAATSAIVAVRLGLMRSARAPKMSCGYIMVERVVSAVSIENDNSLEHSYRDCRVFEDALSKDVEE